MGLFHCALLSCLLLPVALVETLLQPLLTSCQPQRHGGVALSARAEATLGMGCFWKPSEELLKVPGVIDTVVGYTGVDNVDTPPTYDKVCISRDWVEGVRVYYDDEKLSYEALLDAFFVAQEPKLASRQYASLIFPHNAQQEVVATEWLAKNEKRMRDDGVTAAWTRVEPLRSFFAAENYHQRYWQKTRPRIAAMIGLIAISSGILDNVTPIAVTSTAHTAADALVLAGLIYVFAERIVDTKTVEI